MEPNRDCARDLLGTRLRSSFTHRQRKVLRRPPIRINAHPECVSSYLLPIAICVSGIPNHRNATRVFRQFETKAQAVFRATLVLSTTPSVQAHPQRDPDIHHSSDREGLKSSPPIPCATTARHILPARRRSSRSLSFSIVSPIHLIDLKPMAP
jgi:hypothetical protein